MSEPFEGFIGLRQRESLSPVLFALLMNDLSFDLERGLGDHLLKWEEVT